MNGDLRASDLVARLRGDPSPLPAALSALLADLHGSNRRQWHLEDLSRAPDASDADVGRVKRLIDAQNAHRVSVIDQLDAAFADLFPPSDAAPPAVESPGRVCDSLSVLVLRRDMARQCLESDATEALAQSEDELGDRLVAIDAYLDDIRGGRRRFRRSGQRKLYGVSLNGGARGS